MGDLLHLSTPVDRAANYSQSICALYRAFSRSGRLLYVGISNQPEHRRKQHAAEKSWWPEVDRVDIEWFDDRHQAEQAERAAIRNEQPFYNLIRYGSRYQRRVLRWRPSPDTCRRLGQPYVHTAADGHAAWLQVDLETTPPPDRHAGPNRWEHADPDGVLTLLLAHAAARSPVVEILYSAGGPIACIEGCLAENVDQLADVFVDWWAGGGAALDLLTTWTAT